MAASRGLVMRVRLRTLLASTMSSRCFAAPVTTELTIGEIGGEDGV
jgi:hypothetical protein